MPNEAALCLFCASGCEKRLQRELEQMFPCRALYPSFEREEKHNGVWSIRRHALLPGYVFVFAADFPYERIRAHHDVRRILSYADGDYPLRGGDRDFADWMDGLGGNIAISQAVREGTRIRVIAGPLAHYAGQILEVNAHRRMVKVAVAAGEMLKPVWMGFEFVEALGDGWRLLDRPAADGD